MGIGASRVRYGWSWSPRTGLKENHSRLPFRFLVLASLYAFGFGIVGPIIPLHIVALGGGAAVVGGYAIVGTLTNAMLRPVTGRIADKVAKPQVYRVGLVASVCAAVLLAGTGSVWPVLPAGVLVGAGAATFWPALKAAALESSESGHTGTLGRVLAAQEFGTTIGQGLSGVIATVASVRFALGSGAGVLGLALVAAFLPVRSGGSLKLADEQSVASADQKNMGITRLGPDPEEFTQVVRSPRVMASAGVLFLVGATVGSFLPYLALYLKNVLQVGAVGIGLSFATFSVARLAGGLAASRLERIISVRIGLRKRASTLLAVASLLTFGKGLVPFPAFLLLGILLAFTLSVSSVVIMASVTRASTARIAGRLGLLEAASLAGAALGPALGAVAYQTFPGSLFTSSALLCLTASVSAYYATPVGDR